MGRLLVFAALLAIGQAPAVAASDVLPTVFGIQLGAPVSLPECKRPDLPGLPPSEIASYEPVQDTTCRTQPIQLTNSPFRRASVMFPHDKEPLIIVADQVSTYFAAGSDGVIAVEASTPSYGRAENIVAELMAKFGKPTVDRIDKQVVHATPLPSRHVVWHRPGFTVDYQSISDDDVRYGELMIRTDAYDKIDGADTLERGSRRTPL